MKFNFLLMLALSMFAFSCAEVVSEQVDRDDLISEIQAKTNAGTESPFVSSRTMDCEDECEKVCPNNWSFTWIDADDQLAECLDVTIEFCGPNGAVVNTSTGNSTYQITSTGFNAVCAPSDLTLCFTRVANVDCLETSCFDGEVILGANSGSPSYPAIFTPLCLDFGSRTTLCIDIGSIQCCDPLAFNNCYYEFSPKNELPPSWLEVDCCD